MTYSYNRDLDIIAKNKDISEQRVPAQGCP